MIVEIITIGLEVTTGSILNTNSKYISEKLLEQGTIPYYHTSVDDNEERMEEVINIALERANILVITGGLGPTEDDLTKEVVARVLSLPLLKDENIEKKLKNKFEKNKKKMSLNNLKQSLIPEGCKVLNNQLGTAPGIYIEKENKKIILLPGPPKEMRLMFDNEVIPLLKTDLCIIHRSINITGIGESELEMKIKDLINKDNDIIIATFAKESEVEIKIIGKGLEKSIIEEKIYKYIMELKSRFSEYIYGIDNKSIESIVFNLLKEKKYKIGFCESCTGGLISGNFSRISGISEVFDRGIISYSNQSKIEELGVNPYTLEKFGAVSKETATEMAKGMLKRNGLDICLSVTGIAGPKGGTNEKPVGLVYICIADKQKNKVIKCNFTGNRESVQNKVVMKAFVELQKFLLN